MAKLGRPKKNHVLVEENTPIIESVKNEVQTERKANTVDTVTPPVAAPVSIRVKRDWSKKNSLNVPSEILKQHPNMHFVWALRDADKLREKEEMGYTYPTTSIDKRKVGNGVGNETTFVTRKDLILMMIPQEDYIDRVKFKEDEARQRLNSLSVTSRNRTSIQNIHPSLIVGENVVEE